LIEHYPVLHREVLNFFSPLKEGVVVDATLGGGGHSHLILKNFPHIRVVGIDKDPEAIERASERLRDFKDRFTAVHSSFKDVDRVLKDLGLQEVSGFLFDLGVSLYQLKEDRGFSFQKDQSLDMRMDPTSRLTAYEVVNQYPKNLLEKIIFEYGEEKFARKIARLIAEERKKKPIETTGELAEIIKKAYPPALRRSRIHPATKTFQAIRIEVNNELGEIKEGVSKAIDLLEKGGIIQVISFHSLEDRIVKNIFREGKKLKKLQLLTKKPITPTEEEIKENPPSRSAKLRVARRV